MLLRLLTLLWLTLISFNPALLAAEDNHRLRSHHLKNNLQTDEDISTEISFGRDVAAKLLGRIPLYKDPKLNRYLNVLGTSLALHSGRPELRYYFAVLDSDYANAYSTPGGYIFVTRGAIEKMRDEAELAAVLAHEIAHVNLKHIVKQFDVKADDSTSLSGLAQLIGASKNSARVALQQAVDKAVELILQKGFQHEEEHESDQFAVLLLADTQYDPKALLRYLRRLNENERASSTHPATPQRLLQMESLLREEALMDFKGYIAKKRFTQNTLSLRGG